MEKNSEKLKKKIVFLLLIERLSYLYSKRER